MKLESFYLVPHPPILHPEVGGGESSKVSDTWDGMGKVAGRIVGSNPKTIVIISPHGPVYSDAVGVLYDVSLSGNLGAFNAPGISQEYGVDQELSQAIVDVMNDSDIPAALVAPKRDSRVGALDHGMLVPLAFLWDRGLRPKIVGMGASYLPFEDLYKAGMCIRKAVEESPGDDTVVLIASGDLSHRLTPEAPAGYHPDAKAFDDWLVGNLRKFDPMELMNPDRDLLEKAGECGYRPILTMLGAMDGQKVESEILSYEGPFGVGYGVGVFTTQPGGNSLLPDILRRREEFIARRRSDESEPVALARRTVESWTREGVRLDPGQGVIPGLPDRAAVFVSIKMHGELRGCIGTTSPTASTIAEEIVQNAISACSEDPRFEPVGEHELDSLVYSVDVLAEAEPIDGMSALDPKRYGVIVSSKGRRGLLLPDLEGVDTAEQQVDIARKKAGIPAGSTLSLERFEVVRYK